MRTVRSAATLLATASSVERLQPILAGLGFEPAASPADPATRAALRIPSDYRDVCIARGPGALRALVATAPRSLSVREATARAAARLASTAPHILWLLVVADPECEQLAFAAWSTDLRPPRIAALTVHRARVVDSDGETMAALAAARSGVDVLTHARWLDILGRESVTRRFYRSLEKVVHTLAASAPGRTPLEDRTEIALLCVSRLLFLSFLEAKGWLDADRGFLARTFDDCAASGGAYHRRVLLPLLHGTLNTRYSARAPAARAFGRVPFLNGGLFARTPIERRHRSLLFPDATLGVLFNDLLARYRFTAREDSAEWSEAAIDPEMLGKAFESIMASHERRGTGAYFTPQPLVARVTCGAFRRMLADAGLAEGAADDLLSGVVRDSQPMAAVRQRLARVRILDPACGSGAFLVHALERLASMHVVLGDSRDPVEIRRDVLTRSIFGVDRSPFAVWLCELRLWLSMVIESSRTDPLDVPPLPNLDHHIRVGDALSGEGIARLAVPARAIALDPDRRGALAIERLRARYVRAAGPRKQSLSRALARAERARAVALVDAALQLNATRRKDLLTAVRSRDLFGERHRVASGDTAALATLRTAARELRRARRTALEGALPFSFATHFADAAAAGGFDAVVGNPPWVRIHRIPAATRALLRARFAVFHQRGWMRGIELAHAGPGFAAQVDLAALFVERSLELLRPGGVFSLLLPSKLWRSLAGASLRRLLAMHATLLELDDLSESPHAFDAAVYPSMLVATRRPAHSRSASPHESDTANPCPPPMISATIERRATSFRWPVDSSRLRLDADEASPWLLLPPDVRDAFDRMTGAGVPLAESVFGRPHLGVKCGCNAAFIVRETGRASGDGDVIEIEAPGRKCHIERSILRPLVRGETLTAWRARSTSSPERILWTHDAAGAPLSSLPPGARHWLLPWRRRLLARTDAHGRGHWWTLFRTEAARSDRARVVWADIGRSPRAAVLAPHDPTVPLNSCYVVRCPDLTDAHALAALLNGPLVGAWLGAVAEPARGGFHRYFGWTMSLLPLPRDWPAARDALAAPGMRAAAAQSVSTRELLTVSLDAYGLEEDSVAPLLAWASR